MPKTDIVISEFMDEEAVADLERTHAVLYEPDLVDRPADLLGHLADARALIVRNRTQVRGDLLAAASALRCVGRLGVGLDNIDLAACEARGIAVFPATGANNVAVAEYVIATAMMLLRGAYRATDDVIAGTWPRNRLMGREIAGKRLGLVGFGAIAREVAVRARALGTTVAAFDPYLPSDHAVWGDAERQELDDLLAGSDVVSLHVPLTAETRNLIDARALARMKSDAILINAARGGVVDEAAVAAAVRDDRLGGAALDVFASEPLSAEAAAIFKDVPNLILTPHVAGITVEFERPRLAADGRERTPPSRSSAMKTIRLSIAEAEALVVATLKRCRTSPLNARSVARALVAAETDGLKGHGLSRVPTYAAQARVGKVDGRTRVTVKQVRPGLLAIDAAHGFAFPALDLAVEMLPHITRSQGIAAAAIRRSHHCGAAGLQVERLAQDGLVALMFANTPPAIAPWGGAHGLFGTNPIAFACPLAGHPPVIVDLSLSKVARGNVLAAKQRGEPIPEGWALDAKGRPTTDPAAALKGTMLPLGDAKGTALALMVELLAAGLTGANYANEASSFLDAEGPPPGTGQLIIAIDPEAFGGKAAAERFRVLAAAVEAEPGARLPGSRRMALREKAIRKGLVVSAALVAEIEAL